MPTIADNSICIRRWDFSETSQVVSHFTRDHGVLRGLAKGAKRQKGTFSGGMDVLTRGQIVAIVKPGRDLTTLTQWTLEEVFWSVRRDLLANRAALYMADLIHHMLNEQDPHPPLFDALVDALRHFDDRARIGESLLRFQWVLLREAGYQPDLAGGAAGTGARSAEPVLFSAAAGGVTGESADHQPAARPGKSWRVRRETIDLLEQVALGDEITAASAETTERANRLLAAYVREIIGSEVPTLRWAFPGLEA